MSISTGGLAALLAISTFALASCGGDDGGSTASTASAPAVTATATATVTQTAKTTTSATSTSTSTPSASTTTQKTSTTTAKAPPASSGSSGCGPVEIGLRDGDVELTYAKITSQRGVSCQTVTIVAQQWGAQKIGIDKALLPKDWSCSGNSCSGPKGGFSFELYKPQE